MDRSRELRMSKRNELNELSSKASKISGLSQSTISDFTLEQSSQLHLDDSLAENMIGVWKLLDKKIKPEYKQLAKWVTYLGTRSINHRLHVTKKQYMWYLRLSLEAGIPCLPFTEPILQPLPDFTKYMESNNIAKTQYLSIMHKIGDENNTIFNDTKSINSDWYSNNKDKPMILPIDKHKSLIKDKLKQYYNKKEQKINKIETNKEKKIKNNLDIIGRQLKEQIDMKRKTMNSVENKMEASDENKQIKQLKRTNYVEMKLEDKKEKLNSENNLLRKRPMPYKRLSKQPQSTVPQSNSTVFKKKKSINQKSSSIDLKELPRKFPANEYHDKATDDEVNTSIRLNLNAFLTKYGRNSKSSSTKPTSPNQHKYIPITKQIRDSIDNIKRVKFNIKS